MSDIMLTLAIPLDIAQQVEDILLEHPELIRGFSTATVAGHGSAVRLLQPADLVSGHAPRREIRTVGEEEKLRAALDLLRRRLPHARIFYWLAPVLECGRIE